MRPSSTGPAEATDRWALAAGCAFLEGTATGSWGIVGVRGWFQDHLVSGGHMRTPISVNEPPVGTFTLYPRDASALHPQASLPALLTVARNTVLATLRGFIDKPSDNCFVAAALFSGRVRRAHGPTSRAVNPGASAARWIPRPDPEGPLSTLVVNLFVVDMLTHREILRPRPLRLRRLRARLVPGGRAAAARLPAPRREAEQHRPARHGPLMIVPLSPTAKTSPVGAAQMPLSSGVLAGMVCCVTPTPS